MTRAEAIKINLRRIEIVLDEYLETVNPRDKGARIFEIIGYLHLVTQDIERLKSEHFRLAPEFGLARARLRHENSCEPEKKQHNNTNE